MIQVGKINRLKVLYQEGHGYYLEGDEKWGNILLPNKHSPKDLKVGSEVDAFIYLDSEDIIIATTQIPLAQVGQFASLAVKSQEEFGVFLDWGLDKDLFVPFREQLCKMQEGEKYVVYLYVDNSDRICASMRINKFINTTKPPFSLGQQVQLLIYQFTDLGAKAVINGAFSGLLFKDDNINHLQLGQNITGYIKNIRTDNKIDLTTKEPHSENKISVKDLIIAELKKNNGSMKINAKSSAEEINALFGVSRKKFKIALGDLYKKRIITTDDTHTHLVK